MYHPELIRHPESCPALVLNADYTPLSYYPLSLWPWQTAVKAMFLERVDVVAHYDREVHSPSMALKLPSVSRKPVKKEIDMAGKLVQGLHTDFDPADYEDEHRREVEKLIERKASGKQIEAPEEPEEEQSDDLMAALEASLA